MGNLLDKKRSRINDDLVEALMLLKENFALWKTLYKL